MVWTKEKLMKVEFSLDFFIRHTRDLMALEEPALH